VKSFGQVVINNMRIVFGIVFWFLVEFVIVYSHVCLMLPLFSKNAYLKNTPQSLIDKITLLMLSCALMSCVIGICFFQLLRI